MDSLDRKIRQRLESELNTCFYDSMGRRHIDNTVEVLLWRRIGKMMRNIVIHSLAGRLSDQMEIEIRMLNRNNS